MEFKVKKHNKVDFIEIYSNWLLKHKFPLNCLSIMPETFFVCYYKKNPIYAIPFWNTDSRIAIIAFIVSNKDIDYKQKEGGLDYLINYIEDYARKDNYNCIYSSSSNKKIKKILNKNNFINGDTNCQFFKIL